MGRLKAGATGVLGIGDAVPRIPEPARAKVLPAGAVAAFLRASRRPQRGGPSRKYPGAQAVRHQGPSGTASYRGNRPPGALWLIQR